MAGRGRAKWSEGVQTGLNGTGWWVLIPSVFWPKLPTCSWMSKLSERRWLCVTVCLLIIVIPLINTVSRIARRDQSMFPKFRGSKLWENKAGSEWETQTRGQEHRALSCPEPYQAPGVRALGKPAVRKQCCGESGPSEQNPGAVSSTHLCFEGLAVRCFKANYLRRQESLI